MTSSQNPRLHFPSPVYRKSRPNIHWLLILCSFVTTTSLLASESLLTSSDSYQMPVQRQLSIAIQVQDFEKVQELLNQGIDPNMRLSHSEHSPAEQAIRVQGDEKIMKCVLDKIKDITASDTLGNTLLHIASACANLEAVKYLITKFKEKNFSIDKTNESAQTALHLVVASYPHIICTKIIKLLIKEGADVNRKDVHGKTPFFCFMNDLALYDDVGELLEVIKLFFKHGGDPTVQQEYSGDNIFFLIAQESNFITADYLKRQPYPTDQPSKIDSLMEVFLKTEKYLETRKYIKKEKHIKEIEEALSVTTPLHKDIINLLLLMCMPLPWLETNYFKQKTSYIAKREKNYFYYFFLQEVEERGSVKRIDNKVIKNIIQKTIDVDEEKWINATLMLRFNGIVLTSLNGDHLMIPISHIVCKASPLPQEPPLKKTIVHDLIQKENGKIWKRKHATFLIIEQENPRQVMIFNITVGRYYIFRYKPQRQHIALSTLFTRKNQPIRSKLRENTDFIGSCYLLVPKRTALPINIADNDDEQHTLPILELPEETRSPCLFNDQLLLPTLLPNSIPQETHTFEKNIYAFFLAILQSSFN
ncbi:MAG: ankyrin repeat domain-containing protein [Bacteroidota bacterium]